MRNIFRLSTCFFVIFLFFAFLYTPSNVSAQQCVCSDWVCTVVIRNNGWYQTCDCAPGNSGSGGACTSGTCDPGSYVCNRPSGCCPYTAIPPAPVGGGSGGENGNSGGATCTETSPTALSATRDSATSATLHWTPGTPGGGGPYQALWVSTNPDPYTGCAGSAGGTAVCPVRKDGGTVPLTPEQNSFIINNLLTSGTYYYWLVMNFQDATCYKSASSTHMSSCVVSPASISMSLGDTQTILTSVNSNAAIDQVRYTSSGGLLNFSPAVDSSHPYSTNAQAIAVGIGTLTSDVRSASAILCSDTSNVTVIPHGPWWQVKDSDVSSSGDLITDVPIGEYFDVDGTGGFPGIPAASGTTDLDGTNVSSTGWLVDSLQTNAKVYNHTYFNNQIPKDTVITVVPNNTIDGSILESGGTLSYGYYWYRYDGSSSGLDLTITAPVNVGSRKVILLVDSASLYINGRINLTDGNGFFMASVGKTAGLTKGNIYIDPSVGSGTPDLEGIYQADGIFNTGATTIPLSVRGSVTGYDGITMVRDLGGALNYTTPAELFEYAPDQIMLYPKVLGSRKINWKEVAP